MNKKITCEVTVVNKQQLTPNMIRLTLGGTGLEEFPTGYESGYIKFLFPQEEGRHNHTANVGDNTHKPRTRSYTVRAFDNARKQLTVDFATHGDLGPASAWAITSQVNDTINISGPGPTKLVNTTAEWFFLVGDMTSLPAISVNLEKLPNTSKGYAVIEILDSADKQNIVSPTNIDLHWIVNSHPEQGSHALIDKVKTLPWLPGRVGIWVAGEFDMMRSLRHYFKREREVGRENIYASSYWKIGDTDEGNKEAKKQDNDDS